MKRIHTVLHVSDIHIRLNSRHEEYRRVFQNLKDRFETYPVGETLIVVSGDILHNKIDLTPECIMLTVEFLSLLSETHPVVVIPGNHDGLVCNLDRMDSLTAIIDANRLANVFFLKDTGNFRYQNVCIDVFSVFDKGNPADWFSAHGRGHPDDSIWIAMYHGGVGKYVLQNNMVMSGTIPTAAFANYDAVMLGDIHKHQFLTPNIAYAGSLISQNFGETDLQHGFIEWNFQSGRFSFHCISNDYGGYYECTVHPNGDIEWYGTVYPENAPIPRRGNVRVLSADALQPSIIHHLTTTWPDVKWVFPKARASTSSPLSPDATVHRETLSEWMRHGEHHLSEYLSQTGANMSEEFKDEITERFREMCRERIQSGDGWKGSWRILSVEWDHLFGYGRGNRLDFETLSPHQTIGIFGKNSSGKSTIIDILTFLLFGKITRWTHGVSIPKEVIHQRSKTAGGIVCFEADGSKYRLVKSLRRDSKTEKISIKESLFQLDNMTGEYKAVHLEQRRRTDQLLQTMIGEFSEFIFLSVCLQRLDRSFRDMTQKERKEWFFRHFHLDWLEDIARCWTDDIRSVSLEIKTLENDIENTLHQISQIPEIMLTMDADKSACGSLETDIIRVRTMIQADEEQILEKTVLISGASDLPRATEEYARRIHENRLLLKEITEQTRATQDDPLVMEAWTSNLQTEKSELDMEHKRLQTQMVAIPDHFRCPHIGLKMFPCVSDQKPCHPACRTGIQPNIDPQKPGRTLEEWIEHSIRVMNSFPERVWCFPPHASAWQDMNLAENIRQTIQDDAITPLSKEEEDERIILMKRSGEDHHEAVPIYQCPIRGVGCGKSDESCRPDCNPRMINDIPPYPGLSRSEWTQQSREVMESFRNRTWDFPCHVNAWQDNDLAESIRSSVRSRIVDMDHLNRLWEDYQRAQTRHQHSEDAMKKTSEDLEWIRREMEKTLLVYNPDCYACKKNPYNDESKRKELQHRIIKLEERCAQLETHCKDASYNMETTTDLLLRLMGEPETIPLSDAVASVRVDAQKRAWLELFDQHRAITAWEEYEGWQKNRHAYIEWRKQRDRILDEQEERRRQKDRLSDLDRKHRAWIEHLQKKAWLDLFEERLQINLWDEYQKWLENKTAHCHWVAQCKKRDALEEAMVKCKNRIAYLDAVYRKDQKERLLKRASHLSKMIEQDMSSKEDAEKKFHQAQRIIAEMDGVKKQRSFHQKQLEELRDNLLHAQQRFRQSTERISILTSRRDAVQEKEKTLERLCHRKTNLEFLVQTAFHRDGFPLFLLRKFLYQFEEMLDEIIRPFMGEHRRIRLEIDPSGSSVYMRVQSDDGSMSPFLGGMEGFFVDMGMKVAWNRLSTQPRSNIFILDENISVLDTDHLHGLRPLFEFLEEHFDYVIVISHLQVVKDFVQTYIYTENKKNVRSLVLARNERA